MPIVDTHIHTSTVWWEPIETLLFHMDKAGVDQAVMIQFLAETDNGYQFDCQRRYPGRFANVVGIDTKREDAPKALTALAKQGAGGVRFRPFTRSPGADPLAIWRTAGDLDLTVSCLGRGAADFCDEGFVRLVEELPKVRIVLEHLGAMNYPDKDDALRALREKAIGLARYPNVFMKVPPLGEVAQRVQPARKDRSFEDPIPACYDQAYRAFGPDRLMWGSDFPNVCKKEGYANGLNLVRNHFAGKPKDHVDMIFGGTATRLFPVR